MDNAQISKQLEFYSNAIVGFIIIQSLTFCYNFGMSERFNDALRQYKALSTILAIAVLVTMILAILANHFLGEKLQELSTEYAPIIRTIYRGKSMAIAIFSALQIYVIVAYAVFGKSPGGS